MADVVDTMFGWMIDLFSWLFTAFFKVCGWIIKLLWVGITALVGLIITRVNSKKETRDPNGFVSSNGSSESPN